MRYNDCSHSNKTTIIIMATSRACNGKVSGFYRRLLKEVDKDDDETLVINDVNESSNVYEVDRLIEKRVIKVNGSFSQQTTHYV